MLFGIEDPEYDPIRSRNFAIWFSGPGGRCCRPPTTANFFLYCTLNAQFRRAFVDWFCRRRGRHRRDVRRAALGADAAPHAARPPPRDEPVRYNAVARHQPRLDDVRANQFNSPSTTRFPVRVRSRSLARLFHHPAAPIKFTRSERTSFGRPAPPEVSTRRGPTPAPRTLPAD